MQKPPLPDDEEGRLRSLHEHGILDTPPESEYDDIVLLASQICGTPMAAISLIDRDRQWFKARVGLDVDETSREVAFCAHAILDPSNPMVVNDATKDSRFAGNPFVTGDDGIRFYAGAPLLTREKQAIGALCVIDNEPRQLNDQQLQALQALARQLSVRLELRRTSELLKKANEELELLSLTDELTGLYNRRGFLLHAEQQLKLYRSRAGERGLWLMLGDMDGLKKINDLHGHPEGSAAIKKTAEILVGTFRDADILARPGGDEFTVLVLNTLDEVAECVPQRLDANFAAYNEQSGKPYVLGMSIGLIKAPFEGDETIADLIKLADDEMYKDKRRRKAGR